MFMQQNLTVSEISSLLGSAELNAFSRAFKNWPGLRPLAYRTQDQ